MVQQSGVQLCRHDVECACTEKGAAAKISANIKAARCPTYESPHVTLASWAGHAHMNGCLHTGWRKASLQGWSGVISADERSQQSIAQSATAAASWPGAPRQPQASQGAGESTQAKPADRGIEGGWRREISRFRRNCRG